MAEHWTLRNKITKLEYDFYNFDIFELICKMKMIDKNDSIYQIEYKGEVATIKDYFNL